MQFIIEELYKITKGKAIIATDVGQHQMWAAQFYLTDYGDRRWLGRQGLAGSDHSLL